MRVFLVFLTACCVLFFAGPPPAVSDELSDLKELVETLMKRIEELEKNQKEQSEAVEKVPKIEKDVKKLKDKPSAQSVVAEALSKQVNIGGHLKFFPLDKTDGERNDVDQDTNLSAGINDVYLYFSKSLTDWLQLDVAPQVQVLASATPTLGGDIERESSTSVDIDLDEAYMTLRTPYPYDVEFRAGAIYPLFSEEYGRQTWWHEQYHGNNGLLTLQHWQSWGLEIYRNFDFANFSLPVYFYPYINGEDRTRDSDSRFSDNNAMKNMLLHVSPEFFAFDTRFKVLGSFGWGKWDEDDDNDSWQYALGLDVKYRGFNFLGEYLRRERENLPLTGGGTEDGEDEGYYLKLLYTFNPTWKVLVKYSDVDLWYPSENKLLTDNYEVVSFALNYWITEGSTIMPQIDYVDADRSDGSESLEYFRYTLGWRTTF